MKLSERRNVIYYRRGGNTDPKQRSNTTMIVTMYDGGRAIGEYVDDSDAEPITNMECEEITEPYTDYSGEPVLFDGYYWDVSDNRVCACENCGELMYADMGHDSEEGLYVCDKCND